MKKQMSKMTTSAMSTAARAPIAILPASDIPVFGFNAVPCLEEEVFMVQKVMNMIMP
jgi:hypothetical protein